jgi:glycerophosphoryl diester phosphodiesterase
MFPKAILSGMFIVPHFLATFFLSNLDAPNGYCQMIVGHRGASHDAPENTLAAFREAWEQGADGVEGDFYFTADKKIVCIHDKDTKRTAKVTLSVANSTLAQLRELEVGSWKAEKFRGEPIPTFAEVLACIPTGKTFVIELKTGPEIVPILIAELEEYGVNLSDLLVISFDATTISACKKRLPELRAHWLTSYKADKISGQMHPTAEEIAKTLKDCSADGLGTKGDRGVVTAEFVSRLKELGMKEFHVWTVDLAEDAKYFQSLGAVGITTNRPALVRAALN